MGLALMGLEAYWIMPIVRNNGPPPAFLEELRYKDTMPMAHALRSLRAGVMVSATARRRCHL